MVRMSSASLKLARCATGALILAAAPLASRAQPYDGGQSAYSPPDAAAPYGYDGPAAPAADYGPPPGYDAYEPGDVIVRAPHRQDRDPDTGAPIEWVQTSRVVRYDDLDLNTGWGADELRRRITDAAYNACDELDSRYPVQSSDDQDCVRSAVRRAIDQTPLGDDR